MRWTDACSAYPAQWLVVETPIASSSHRAGEITVIEVCADGRAAMHRYRELCHLHPERSFCFLYTQYPLLELRARTRVLSDEPAPSAR